MSKPILTKSLFNTGVECPRKLFYTLHPESYKNEKVDDQFIKSLADGGFQVGALAKIYHPEGVDLSRLSIDEAITKTSELLKQDKVTIFEGAINHDNMLIRFDILKKEGNNVFLYEVKAKSFNPNKDVFTDKRSKQFIASKWTKYLYDIAYQAYVLQKYNPILVVMPYLTLVNKNLTVSVNELNQRFKITKNYQGRVDVEVKNGTNLENVGNKILIDVDVAKEVASILDGSLSDKKTNKVDKLSFEEKIYLFKDGIINDRKLASRLDKECKKCEFRCSPLPELKSGFEECWGVNYKSSDNFVFDVWNFQGADKAIKSGRIMMHELLEADFKIVSEDSMGLSKAARQWLQVSMDKNQSNEAYVDKDYLIREMSKWKYPLHFIDFETASVAIPFNAGRKPYEQIAFQFSHHTIDSDGTIKHSGQYINSDPGVFPNFDFARNLKLQLESDSGTIFRYSNHENSILCSIIEQLLASNEQDKEELIAWIKTITNKSSQWEGARSMVDLCEVVVKSFYHRLLYGSNSLKYVLPAILSNSTFLQNKYKYPIYGGINGIQSLNFLKHSWVQYDASGRLIDPYALLPDLLKDFGHNIEAFFEDDDIRQGGAAMTAYAKLQFTEMSLEERTELRNALLQYCELDTFAMVLLYEYLSVMCKN